MSVSTVLKAVRERLSDPEAWVQGMHFGRRDSRGRVRPHAVPSNCCCLSWAITEAIEGLPGNDVAFCELRSEVERELLTTIEQAGGPRYPAVHMWQDRKEVTHPDVLELLDCTLARLGEAA